MHNIVIRVDGGRAIGLGHLSRCVALAQELKNLGCTVVFVSNSKHEIVSKNGFEIIDISMHISDTSEIGTPAEIGSLKEILEGQHIDCIIVDRYDLKKEYFLLMKEIAPAVVYIDDLNSYRYPVDMVINGNCYAAGLNYMSYDNDTRLLLGSRYLLLRKEFREAVPNTINRNVRCIMVTTGGSNPDNTMESILKGLAGIRWLEDFVIKVIVGSGFGSSDELDMIARNCSNVELIYDANMLNVMRDADIAVSASGSTLYELSRLGIPSISFIIGYDQIMLAEKMDSMGCTINLGWYSKEVNNQIEDNLKKLCSDYVYRSAFSKRCKALIDGMGAVRCAEEVVNLLDGLLP